MALADTLVIDDKHPTDPYGVWKEIGFKVSRQPSMVGIFVIGDNDSILFDQH